MDWPGIIVVGLAGVLGVGIAELIFWRRKRTGFYYLVVLVHLGVTNRVASEGRSPANQGVTGCYRSQRCRGIPDDTSPRSRSQQAA